MKKFRFHWIGDSRYVRTPLVSEGKDVADAFTRAGFGAGALSTVDYYEEITDAVDDVTTPRGVAVLLKLRRELTNVLNTVDSLGKFTGELGDSFGSTTLNEISTLVGELRTRYQKAMPKKHIEGVEAEKVKLGLDYGSQDLARQAEASGRGNW